MSDTVEICREAWRGSKSEGQPDYDDLSETYREMLSARAQPNIDAGVFSNDPMDTLYGFDVNVFNLSHPRTPPEPKKAAKKKAVKKTK